MNPYIVCHAAKLEGFGMAFHIDRAGVYQPDGSVTLEPDPRHPGETRTKYPEIKHPENHKWNKGKGSEARNIEKDWNEVISSLPRKPQAGKIQKTRNGHKAGETVLTNFIEFAVSAGEEHWVRLRNEFPNDEEYFKKCEEYFSDARSVLKELYSHGVLMKWMTHYEEETPHCHVLMIPLVFAPMRNRKDEIEEKAKKKVLCIELKNAKGNIVEEEKIRTKLKELEFEIKKSNNKRDKVLRYSVSEFLGGAEGLRNLQDRLFEKLGSKWQVERGEKYSNARHTDQSDWQRELSIKDKEVTEGLKLIDETRKEQKNENDKILYNKEETEKLLNKAQYKIEFAEKAAEVIKTNAVKNRKVEDDFIITAKNVNLKKTNLPEPLKNEKAVSYIERVKGWFKGVIYKLIKKEKELEEKEVELEKKHTEIDIQLQRLMGKYGEENKILQIKIFKNKHK